MAAPKAVKTNEAARPKLVVGWLIAADLRDTGLRETYGRAQVLLKETLERQFPMFDWQMPEAERRSFQPRGALKILELLEVGGEEKLQRRWDYALVLVPNALEPRRRISALGAPSSALETAVLSSASLGKGEDLAERIAALAQHLLGHLFTLETRSEGPMRPPAENLRLEPFPEDQAKTIISLLYEVADARLEETQRNWNVLSFYVQSFFSDWWGILKSIIGYRPWRIPLYLGRLTAAVAVSLLLLLLTAESWEIGVNMQSGPLILGSVISIFIANLFLFFGQRLDQVGRGRSWSEQLARSRIVLFGTLLLGILSLWALMLVLLFTVSLVLPVEVLAAWSGFAADDLPRLKYVTFMASIGILAAALGGNLEEEDEVKAELLIDEEV